MRLLTAYVELKPKLSPGFNAQAALAGRKAGAAFTKAFEREMKSPKLKVDLLEARRAGNLMQKAFNSAFKATEVKVKANLESTAAKIELDRLTRDRKVNVRVDVKGGGITGGRGGGGSGGNILSGLGGGAGGSLPSITGILSKSSTGISGVMSVLKASLVALSPILVSLGASAGFASTSLIALGPAAIGAATGVGTAIVAFSGIVAALKLYDSTQKQAGQADDQAAARAKAVRDARDGLAAATRGVTSAQEDYKTSERNVSRAQQDARDAQKDLNNARKEAAQDLMDLKELVSDLASDEEGAQIAIARALEEQKRVNADTTSTILDRREAAHNLAEAEDRLNDIQTKRAQSMEDLTTAEAKGVKGSDKVISAQRAQQDAAQKVKDAQLDLKHSQEAIAVAIQAQTKATEDLATAQSKGGTAAQQQLNQAIADMSPEGRKMYYQLVQMKEGFKGFRKEIETATLPGFNKALRDLQDKGKDGVSVLDIMKKAMLGTGREISSGTSRLGDFIKSPFFKNSLIKITNNNTEAFHHLNNAVIVLLRPITRLFTASSPLVVRFSTYVEKLANTFDHWVQSFSDNDLSKYFKSAGDELSKWWTLAVNLGASLMNIFKLSLPTGSSLIDRLDAFSLSVRKFTESKAGQDQIGRFFQFFRDIDYGQMVKVVGQAILIATVFSAAKFAASNPLLAFLGLMAKRYPAQTEKLIDGVTGALSKAIDFVAKNKAAANLLIAVLGAYAGLKVLSGVKIPSLPGFNGNTGESKVASAFMDWVKISPAGRGGTLVTPLYVFVTNSKGGLPDAGVPGDAGPVAKTEGVATKIGKLAKLAATASLSATLGIAFFLDDWLESQTWMKKWEKATAKWIDKQGNAIGREMKEMWNNVAGGIWDGIKELFTEGPVELGRHVEKWWDDFVKSLKKLFGIASPSTVMYALGADLGRGLVNGTVELIDDLPGKLSILGRDSMDFLVKAVGKGVPNLLGKFTSMMTLIKTGISLGLDKVIGLFGGISGRAETAISTLPGKFKTSASLALKHFEEFPGKAVGFIAGLPKSIQTAISGIPGLFLSIWDAAKAKVITGINGLIGIINSFLSSVDSVTSKFGIHIGQISKVGEAKIAPALKGGGIGGNDFKGHALGGKIRGAGTKTSDSILSRLSDKEYVIKADSAESIGTKNLDYMNRTGRLPGFAKGGQMSIDQILGIMSKSGIQGYSINATNQAGYPIGPTASHGAPDGGYHDSGQAVDFGGYGDEGVRSSIAQYFYKYKSSLLELIHSKTKTPPYPGWYVKNGHDTAPYGPASQHYSHVHVAMTRAVGEAILGGKTPPADGGDIGGGLFGGAIGSVIGGLANKATGSLKGKVPPMGDLMAGIIKQVIPIISGRADAGSQKMGLSSDQNISDIQGGQLEGDAATNAKIIMQTTASLGGSLRDQTIAVATAWVESKLKNIDYGDRDSLGLFQQRNPWGPAGTRLTPSAATRMFLSGGMGGQRGLFAFPQRDKWSMGRAAQKVQVSAFPDRYDDIGVPIARRFTHYTGYDQGGWLPPGDTLVRNSTGQKEAVLSPEKIKEGAVTGTTIVKVFIGDREITDIVRTEVTKADAKDAERFRHGRSF